MNEQTRVFIAGSRRLPRLSKDAKHRIGNIIYRGFTVMVGDANGADRAVQQYLSEMGYKRVIIFCTENICRNNLGNWPTRAIRAENPARRNFEFYRAKDRAMVEEADYGLMFWDGKSRGTLMNAVGLIRRGRPLVLYVAPAKSFLTLRQAPELLDVVSRFNPQSLPEVDRELQTTDCEETIPSTKVDEPPALF